jgi:hypothetical protein
MKKLNYRSRPLFAAWAFAALLIASSAPAQNVGIGVSNPQSKLTVNGTTASGGIAVGDSTYTSTAGTVAPTNGAIIQGNVGIGKKTPLAPLHVGGGVPINWTGSTRSYFLPNSTGLTFDSTTSGTDNPVSAIFDLKVYGIAFIADAGTYTASDTRLKHIIGRSNSAKDLETLKQIEVTDYTMKDTMRYGNRPLKRVIAQQVDCVYPTAVKPIGLKGVTFTPDIYAVSESIKLEKPGVYTISLAKAHSLKDGDTLRVITEKNDELSVVAHVVNDTAFTVETKEALGNKVFVYGKECLDLKGIDYDAISMLNVSATQELAKKVEALEKENFELKAHTNRLTAIEEEQQSEIAALKAANEKLSAMASDIEALKKAAINKQTKDNDAIHQVVLNN